MTLTIIIKEARKILVKLSVDLTIMKVRSHVKEDQVVKTQKLYQTILLAFLKDKSA